jgi:hypothetical protein
MLLSQIRCGRLSIVQPAGGGLGALATRTGLGAAWGVRSRQVGQDPTEDGRRHDCWQHLPMQQTTERVVAALSSSGRQAFVFIVRRRTGDRDDRAG